MSGRAPTPARRKAVNAVRRRKKDFLRAYKAVQGCKDCGEHDPVVLDFHHREPVGQHHGRMMQMAGNGWQRLLQELQSCDVLCANCHRRRHAAVAYDED